MVDDSKPKILTIFALLIGALIILMLSIACVLDWVNKLKIGADWSVNLWYHPLTGVISIMYFCILVLFLMEKREPGKMQKIRANLENRKGYITIIYVLTIISFVLMTSSSYLLLISITSAVELLIAFHTLMGIIFGMGIMMSLLKQFISRYVKNPVKFQTNLVIIVIISVALFTVIVVIGRAIGLISL